jgi:hypothetical protein
VWQLIKDEVDGCIVGVLGRQEAAWGACVEMLAERPRQRKLQRLPEEVVLCNQGLPEASLDEFPQAA